jgi:hexulose-6-phosphate isomerase
MYPVAIMQGRLSDDPEGRFQFFPSDWAAEFPIAKKLGFVGIEWLCDWPEMEAGENPLLDFWGRTAISHAVRSSGIPVVSVCADWYMKYDLRYKEQATSDWLLTIFDAATLTADRRVLVPLLEKNAPLGDAELAAVRESLSPVLPALDKLRVSLAFESELDAEELSGFVDSFGSPWVGVVYDIGNCTSYGFDCASDIRALGSRVKGVHIKDRRRGFPQSVPLGEGDADFRRCLEALAVVGWHGHLVMQAWRGRHYLEDAKRQLAFLDSLQKEVFGGT